MELTVDGSTLVLGGQLDVRCISELREALYDHLETHMGQQDDVVLDFTDVESVDLVVLRMLAVASRISARRGHQLKIRDCPPSVRRLLHLSHLRALVQVEPTAASA